MISAVGTREDILAAAVAIARESGLPALSVRAVAARAGVGPTTLRHHFPSQAQLHAAVAGQIVPQLLPDLDIADSTRPAADRLFACLLQFLPPAAVHADPSADSSVAEQGAMLRSWFAMYRAAMVSTGAGGGDAGGGGDLAVITSARGQSRAAIARWCLRLAEEGHLIGGQAQTVAARALAVVDGINLALLLDVDSTGAADAEHGRETLRWFVDTVVGR